MYDDEDPHSWPFVPGQIVCVDNFYASVHIAMSTTFGHTDKAEILSFWQNPSFFDFSWAALQN